MNLPEKETLGWIGVGVMGLSMARRLMDAGHPLVVNSRTKAKASALLEAGAFWADSPAEVASKTRTLFTMVGYPSDVEAIFLEGKSIVQSLLPDSLVIDMTTTKPSLAQKIAAVIEENGSFFLDAPVSGGDVGAREGTLSIMVGGAETAFQRARPFFSILGKNIIHQGSPGAGQHTKMCNQIVIAGTMIGVCESLLYAKKAGLNLEAMLSSISKGAAGCWTLDHLAPRIMKRNFDPGFFIDHFIKDMSIALEESAKFGISLPGLALVHQLYLAVKAQGHGKSGTQALMLGLEKLSSVSQ